MGHLRHALCITVNWLSKLLSHLEALTLGRLCPRDGLWAHGTVTAKPAQTGPLLFFTRY